MTLKPDKSTTKIHIFSFKLSTRIFDIILWKQNIKFSANEQSTVTPTLKTTVIMPFADAKGGFLDVFVKQERFMVSKEREHNGNDAVKQQYPYGSW